MHEYYQKCCRLFQRGVANYEKLKGRDTPKKRGGDWSKEPDLDWARQPYPGNSDASRGWPGRMCRRKYRLSLSRVITYRRLAMRI